jgi:hypothetical protein
VLSPAIASARPHKEPEGPGRHVRSVPRRPDPRPPVSRAVPPARLFGGTKYPNQSLVRRKLIFKIETRPIIYGVRD